MCSMAQPLNAWTHPVREVRSCQTLGPRPDNVSFLNHGSFGATPFAIREEQRKWQDLLEEEPVRFYEDLAMGLHGELSQSTRQNATLRCRRLGNN